MPVSTMVMMMMVSTASSRLQPTHTYTISTLITRHVRPHAHTLSKHQQSAMLYRPPPEMMMIVLAPVHGL